jgi:hypothetical protein
VLQRTAGTGTHQKWALSKVAHPGTIRLAVEGRLNFSDLLNGCGGRLAAIRTWIRLERVAGRGEKVLLLLQSSIHERRWFAPGGIEQD